MKIYQLEPSSCHRSGSRTGALNGAKRPAFNGHTISNIRRINSPISKRHKSHNRRTNSPTGATCVTCNWDSI